MKGSRSNAPISIEPWFAESVRLMVGDAGLILKAQYSGGIRLNWYETFASDSEQQIEGVLPGLVHAGKVLVKALW